MIWKPFSSFEWVTTLLGLGLVVCAAVLIEATPRAEALQIGSILLASIVVSAICLRAACYFSRKRHVTSVASKEEDSNHAQFADDHA